MRILIWISLVFMSAAWPLAVQAQMPFPLMRGYEQSSPLTEASVSFDAQSALGQELAGVISDKVRWVGGWELYTGMWREFQLDGAVENASEPLWLNEITRGDDDAPAGSAPPVPYASAGCRTYIALGLLPSVRNPEVRRAWIFSFSRDAAGKLSLINRYEVCPGEFNLDEQIDAVVCDDLFCLDFFGDGGLALVLPWRYRLLGFYGQIRTGADVVRIANTGILQPYGSQVELGSNDDYRDLITVSDLDQDGKWELQARVQLMDGGYFGRYLIQPNLWRGDWALKYDPRDPFYQEQADFYRVFLSELLSAAANLHQHKYSGQNLHDNHYNITIGDTVYDIDELVEDQNVALEKVLSFEQSLVHMQRRLLRGG